MDQKKAKLSYQIRLEGCASKIAMKFSRNRTKYRRWILGVLGTFLSTSPLCAQVIFDGGISSPVIGGYYADGGINGNGYGGVPFTAAGDVFTSQADTTVESIQFTGSYEYTDAPSDSFTIDLYSVSAGTPADLLLTSTLSNETRTNIGTSVSGADHFQYEGNLSAPFALSAGTEYFLDITDRTTTDPLSDFEFLLDANNSGNGVAYAYAPRPSSPPFEESDESVSFAIHAEPVPEPSVFALLTIASGYLFLRFLMRRMATAD